MSEFKKAVTDPSTFTFLNPYIIAEIGVNHEGSMEKAKLMIEQVARAGGHCAKFQTYKADKIASKEHAPSYWDLKSEPCKSQHELFMKYDAFGEKEYAELAAHCKKHGVDFVSTPFDLDAVDMLDPLMSFFKIASADVTNIPLLRKVGGCKKPVLMSTGAATLDEVRRGVTVLKEAGATEICLLHCVLNYPTPKDHAQMALMGVIQREFGQECSIGYSDHVAPDEDGSMPALEYAALSGAVALEKHFTFDKTLPGNDHYHSFNEAEMKAFTKKLAVFRTLHGDEHHKLDWEAQAVSHARRRIMAASDIKAGEILTEDKLIALRSGVGIEIAKWDDVIGKKATNDISASAPVKWDDVG